MNSRRTFFKIAASFVAGCAMNVGALAARIRPEEPESIPVSLDQEFDVVFYPIQSPEQAFGITAKFEFNN